MLNIGRRFLTSITRLYQFFFHFCCAILWRYFACREISRDTFIPVATCLFPSLVKRQASFFKNEIKLRAIFKFGNEHKLASLNSKRFTDRIKRCIFEQPVSRMLRVCKWNYRRRGATTLIVTEQISVEVMYRDSIREVICSILGNEFAYPESGISWFTSVPSGNFPFQILFPFVIRLPYPPS